MSTQTIYVLELTNTTEVVGGTITIVAITNTLPYRETSPQWFAKI